MKDVFKQLKTLGLSLLMIAAATTGTFARTGNSDLSATPKVHYTFNNVSGKTVTDDSGSGYDATIVSSASVMKMGKYNVLDLGNGTGYLDMGASIGNVVKDLEDYTVSAYYRVDNNASLSGNGYFLWSFSMVTANSSTSSQYMAYRLNAQRFAISTGGYSNESGIEAGGNATKNRWQHVVYRQTGTTGELFVDGQLVVSSTSIPKCKTVFSSASPYNWIGRAPFSGDAYLSQTLVSDFRLYDSSIPDSDISALASITSELEYEFKYGTPGDFTALNAEIERCNSLLNTTTGENYPVNAIAEFRDVVDAAQEIATQMLVSQTIVDAKIAELKSGYTKLSSLSGFDFKDISPDYVYDTNKGFRHPGALHTQEDFDRIKKLLDEKDPTIVAAYDILKSNEYSQSTIATWPVETIVRGGSSGQNYMNAARGAAMAYQNALRWKISGDKAHADRAVIILNSWASICKHVGGDTNQSLASGLYGYQFANAAELIRDYEGWNREDFKVFQEWMLDIWYPRCIDFLRRRHDTWLNAANGYSARPGHYWSNWGLCNVLAVMSIGILCDDVFIYNQGVSFYKHDQVGTFTENRTAPIINDGLTEFIGNLVPDVKEDQRGAYGKLGQMQESGRDQGHALMAAGLAVDICQIAWNQGDDLFSYMDNRLAAGLEFIAAYNMAGIEAEDLPWTEYWYHDCRTAVHNSWRMGGINGGGRGGHRPVWGRVIGHYEGVKGVKMQYSAIANNALGIDNGGGAYGQTSGGFDHLGFTTLTCYRPAVSAEMAPTRITPYLVYEGKTLNQSELGGIKNTFEHLATSAIPAGSVVKFCPELPSDVTDNGSWEWSTGEKSKDIEKTFDKSAVLYVTYTNDNGVKSTQMFSIAVAGDSRVEKLNPYIYLENGEINDTIATVPMGSNISLAAWCKAGWGFYRWDNGETTDRITINNIRSGRKYNVIFTNQGGQETKCSFEIKVYDIVPAYSVNGGTISYSNNVFINNGNSVTLSPQVSAEFSGGRWEWSNGATTQEIIINDIQSGGIYSVNYFLDDKTFTLDYNICIAISNKTITDGEYFIRNPLNDTYLTNDGTYQPVFKEKDDSNIASQTWNIFKDILRYKFVSVLDEKYLNWEGMFTDNTYSRTKSSYILHGLENSNLHAIQNSSSQGNGYWGITADNIIDGNASTAIDGYPFEFVSTTLSSIDKVTADFISVYPNPVEDMLNINISEDILSANDKAQLIIFSQSGILINIFEVKAGHNSFDSQNIESGVYFGVIKSNDINHRFKIVKK